MLAAAYPHFDDFMADVSRSLSTRCVSSNASVRPMSSSMPALPASDRSSVAGVLRAARLDARALAVRRIELDNAVIDAAPEVTFRF